MRRSPPRKTPLSMSLFPFLAVLICTMGAMIVLLVLVVQQARVQADTISDQRSEDRAAQQAQLRAEQEQLRQQEEDFQWQQQVLEQQRRELTEQLGERRLQLSHLEDHIQRLEQRWRQLQAEAEAARRSAPEDQLAAAQLELERLRTEIEAKQSELAAARDELKRRKPAYSIIPYDGPHGTRRRPIYVECRETAIIIQPENVVLTPDDFAGPLGPGNPLDAVLRAVREYWARVEGGSSRGEPYPLLIVRPDGAVAYSMARSAMAAWDDEFGYELVDDQMELRFPPSDPHLRKYLEAAVATARQRQALLAAAMPSRFSGPRAEGFRVADRDADLDYGSLAEGYGRGGPAPRGSASRGAPGFGGSPGSATAGSQTGWGPAPGSPPQVDSASGAGLAAGGPVGAPGFYQPAPVGHAAAAAGSPAGSGSFSGSGAGDAALSGAAGPAAGPLGGGAASGTAGPAGGPGGGSSVPSGGQGGNSPTPSGDGAGAAVQLGSAPDAAAGAGNANLKSIAQQKGANWALPNVAGRSTGITRPIAVECFADRLVILPDRGDSSQPQVLVLDGPTERAMQEFVSGVWTHVERWGMAVAGGYWKPVLKVRVAPEGETRFRELQILLQDSGIEVEKR